MSTLVAGLVGTAVGIGLKWIIDLINERRRNAREDRLWRRERFVEAAADLLVISREQASANGAVVRAVFGLGNAERNQNEAIVQSCREQLQRAYERYDPLPGQSDRAFELLRLYAPDAVVDKAIELRSAADVSPEIGAIHEAAQAVESAGDELVHAVRQSIE